MNREIKFRAWDGKKMHHDGDESFDFGHHKGYINYMVSYIMPTPDKVFHCIVDQNNFEHYLEYIPGPDAFTEAIVMQFIGLWDKTGKPIFEGDIVKHPIYGTTIVRYEYSSFYPFMDTKMRYGWYASECSVIGNIYENPELIPQSEEE